MMIRTTVRRARQSHTCGTCARIIPARTRYLEHVASPYHGDLGNRQWWRIAECQVCAGRYGRGDLFHHPDGYTVGKVPMP